MPGIYTETVSFPLTLPLCHFHNLFADTISMSNPQSHVRMQLRLPSDVHASLVAATAESDRSLNGEIVNRLRATLKVTRSGTATAAKKAKG